METVASQEGQFSNEGRYGNSCLTGGTVLQRGAVRKQLPHRRDSSRRKRWPGKLKRFRRATDGPILTVPWNS